MIKKLLISTCFLLGMHSIMNAQTVSINTAAGTSANVVHGLSNYHALEAIYLESEIGAGNFLTAGSAIDSVGFSWSTSASTAVLPLSASNFLIYMQNVPSSTTTFTTGTYSLTGYTQVFSGTINFTRGGWNSVKLNTQFVRTAGTNLQVLIIRNNNSIPTGNPSFECSNGNAAAGTSALTSRRYNGTTAPAENSTSLATSAFRPSIQLKRLYNNDIAIGNIYALGTVGRGAGSRIQGYVINNSFSAKTNVVISLNVTGANTYSTSVTIPNLAEGAQGFINFPAYIPTNTGINTITVSTSADDFAGNNSTVLSQNVTTSQMDYSIGTTATSGVSGGQNSLIGAKFYVPYANRVTQANIYFSTAGNTYNVMIYNNNPTTGLPNTVLLPTDSVVGLTTTVGLNTITFPTPVAVTDSFYLVIRQTGASMGTSYQSENPCRSNAYFLLSTPTSTWFDLAGNPANTFRLMMGVTFQNPLPVTFTNFSGTKQNAVNNLTWTTSTEQNNAGFYLERSADGKNFSSLEFIASKAVNGNSNSSLTYSFPDTKPLKGDNYYRLKQVDKDGKSAYSSIVLLRADKKGDLQISNIYPNPVKNEANLIITAPASDKINVAVIDMAGKVISQLNTQVISGDNIIKLNTSGLAAGTYSVKVICSNGCEAAPVKMIKQ